MNYKLQIHFLNDVTTWRAHISALISMVIIKSPFLHQRRLHSNGNGFKIVQKSFIQSSSNLQEANHLGFSCQHGQDAITWSCLGWFIPSYHKYDKSIILMESVADMWNDLKAKFFQGDLLRISDLQSDVAQLKQGNHVVSEYSTKLRIIWDEIENFNLTQRVAARRFQNWWHKEN